VRYSSVAGIDKRISRLVQGIPHLNSTDLYRAFALLDAVFEMGCTTFDTARTYQGGDSEKVLGHWIHSRRNRDQVVVISKGCNSPDGRSRVTTEDVRADLAASLRALDTDCIDLYLLHRDNPERPVGPIIEVLNEQVAAGRVRAFGGSNWSQHRIQQANQYAASRGLVPFAASSPHFSLAMQLKPPWAGCISIAGPEQQAARDWYRDSGMPLFTWSSLAGGFLTGHYERGNLEGLDGLADRLVIDSYCSEANFRRLDRARTLGQRKGASLSQIAISYVLDQGLNTFALVGCRSGEEFAALADGDELNLTPGEIAWLEAGEADPADGRS
jgi:aryl-alcohol dehydrogenase-like predicted oxidoreductase